LDLGRWKIRESGHVECQKEVGANSIVCTVVDFRHSRCFEGTGWEERMKEIEVEYMGKLECGRKFCYLGDIIVSGNGAEKA
jgi:hypothetical protein